MKMFDSLAVCVSSLAIPQFSRHEWHEFPQIFRVNSWQFVAKFLFLATLNPKDPNVLL